MRYKEKAIRRPGRADKRYNSSTPMKQTCAKCGQTFRDGDKVRAVVLSIYHEISSAVAYAIEQPYDCLSLEHVECPESEPGA